jgi:hypothetical protein
MAAANKQQMSTDAKGQRRTSTDTMIFNTNDVMSTDVKGEQVPPSKKKKKKKEQVRTTVFYDAYKSRDVTTVQMSSAMRQAFCKNLHT